MSEYKLVFSGKLSEGCSVEQASANLKNGLKFTDQAVAQMFKPRMKPLVVKRVESLDKANQLCSRFLKLGVVLDIIESDTEAVNQTGAAAPVPAKAAAVKKPVAEDPQSAEETGPGVADRLKGVLSAIFSLSILSVLLGIFLCYTYMPYPDGMLRHGFIAGLVALFVGWLLFPRIRGI